MMRNSTGLDWVLSIATKQVWLKVAFYIILAFLLSGCATPSLVCNDPLGCISVRPGAPIQFAYLLPITGDASTLGLDSAQGIEVAFDSIDETILGHPLALRGFDSGCRIESGERAARLLINDPEIVGVIGPGCSGVVDTVLPLIEAANGVMISPSTTAVTLPASTADPLAFFQTVPHYSEQATLAARFAMADLDTETAIILHDETDYAETLQNAFKQTYIELGGRVLAEQSIQANGVSLAERLDVVVTLEPDLIYLALSAPDANGVLNKLIEMNAPETIAKIGADSLFFPEFPILTGSAADGVYLTGFVNNGDDYDLLLNRWQALSSTLPQTPYHAFAYDATLILAQAIELVADVDNQGGLLIGRGALRQAIADTDLFAGVTGPITCSTTGACNSSDAIGVYQISEAQIFDVRWPPVVVR